MPKPTALCSVSGSRIEVVQQWGVRLSALTAVHQAGPDSSPAVVTPRDTVPRVVILGRPTTVPNSPLPLCLGDGTATSSPQAEPVQHHVPDSVSDDEVLIVRPPHPVWKPPPSSPVYWKGTRGQFNMPPSQSTRSRIQAPPITDSMERL